jgi:hypothetical protein
MLKTIVRAILALQGAIALLIAAQTFIQPDKLAEQLGYALIGDLGLSSFRADIGGFFALAGLFMLLAAWRADRQFVLPPLVLVGLALSARLATLAETGFVPEVIQPISVEAVTVVMLLIGYAMFRKD